MILKHIAKYIIGFPCITKLENHYTEASHRIFFNTEDGMVTIFWFEKDKDCICRNKKFSKKIEKFLR